MKNWTAPEHWLKITTIDTHTAGELFRIIKGGYPELTGETILGYRRYAMENLDHLRTAYITGRNEFLIDPNDPLRHGFLLR